ncbi:hypothetical protein AB0F03_07450 [Streptomyces sp. NPDC028722]|uniref:hypothetical protein n=1 Tax=Streptomyces sp. NPDC028722 TaxID=3155016 RepID=UPI0033C55418
MNGETMWFTCKSKLVTLGGVAALTAGLLMTGASPAPAVAVNDDFSFSRPPLEIQGVYETLVTNETKNKTAGYARWISDGDKLIAHDGLADGYAIVAHLSDGRTASTQGIESPATGTATGDLPENHTYKMWVCAVKGSFSRCSPERDVKS